MRPRFMYALTGGFIAVLSAVLLLALVFAIGGNPFLKPHLRLSVDVEDVSGIKPGDDVTYAGHAVGRVAKIVHLEPDERQPGHDGHVARIYLEILQQPGGFDAWVWQFVDGEPVNNHFLKMEDVPANTPRSDLMAREMKKRGFKFVGSTICYAFMQATGMVNDHTTDCFRCQEIENVKLPSGAARSSCE